MAGFKVEFDIEMTREAIDAMIVDFIAANLLPMQIRCASKQAFAPAITAGGADHGRPDAGGTRRGGRAPDGYGP